eukprot:TRINITY_DN9667_c0_g2_i1.p1 TRINITY_DN9667_c0_g2~~TRINITY_DN9667_c0_g2_i1.p1  ORF type:complete len:229 (-),score=11.35 TRINITY_DN9667_c0_g2_i1:241-927(-)
MAAASSTAILASIPVARPAARAAPVARPSQSLRSSFVAPCAVSSAASSAALGSSDAILTTARVSLQCRGAVTCSLPHANWSARAIKTFGMAELEARKLKYPTTGTEALLMGMLTEGTSYGARYLRANGVQLMALRAATVELLGKADMYFFSPEHPPLTEPALAALQWAVNKHKEMGGEGEISTALVLLGVWEQRQSAGHKLLAQLGFTDALANALAADVKNDLAPVTA